MAFRQEYESLLDRATKAVPQVEILWLMYAKSRWMEGDVNHARTILTDAFAQNPNSEGIWMAAVKLESENNEFPRARKLLDKARRTAPSARFFFRNFHHCINIFRLWMKSAWLEWCLGELDAANKLCKDGLAAYPDFAKLYMMLGQICEQQKNYDEARQWYTDGVRRCQGAIPLWILLSRLEESQGNVTKARSDLEKARLRNPKNEDLWMASVSSLFIILYYWTFRFDWKNVSTYQN